MLKDGSEEVLTEAAHTLHCVVLGADFGKESSASTSCCSFCFDFRN